MIRITRKYFNHCSFSYRQFFTRARIFFDENGDAKFMRNERIRDKFEREMDIRKNLFVIQRGKEDVFSIADKLMV